MKLVCNAACASQKAVAEAPSLEGDAEHRNEAFACCRSSGVEHSLGKGEVGGSNPLGSTIHL